MAEELLYRPTLEELPAADREHLTRDMERAYLRLLQELPRYLAHLREKYPYLFSLAARINPLDPTASVVIERSGGD